MGQPAQYPSTSTATAADAMRAAITRPRFRGVLSLAAFRIMTTQRERENCKAALRIPHDQKRSAPEGAGMKQVAGQVGAMRPAWINAQAQ